MLLSSGLWGLGTFLYIPPSEENKKGQVWLREFHPFQLANVDIEYFKESRSSFTTIEWIDLIVLRWVLIIRYKRKTKDSVD